MVSNSAKHRHRRKRTECLSDNAITAYLVDIAISRSPSGVSVVVVVVVGLLINIYEIKEHRPGKEALDIRAHTVYSNTEKSVFVVRDSSMAVSIASEDSTANSIAWGVVVVVVVRVLLASIIRIVDNQCINWWT